METLAPSELNSIIEQISSHESELCWMTSSEELIRVSYLSDDHLQNILIFLSELTSFMWPAYLWDNTYLGKKDLTYWTNVMESERSRRELS